MYIKYFDQWNRVKKKIDEGDRFVTLREGEIRWVSFGVNVGSEIDGKGNSFARPALIISLSGLNIALVVPMSTKIKSVSGYIPLTWNEKVVSLCIHQTRTVSQKRILSRIGRISDQKLMEQKENIKKFFRL